MDSFRRLPKAASHLFSNSTSNIPVSNPPLYDYQLLEHPDSIRVLILHPSLNFKSPVLCTIKHVSLSDRNLEYEAISYTWGDVTQQQPIYFKNQGKSLKIGVNGSQALRHLRNKMTDRVLWMDAICIDQRNDKEKGHQVRHMHQIYDHASRVLVHLGEHTESSRFLFEQLAKANMKNTSQLHAEPTKRMIKALDELFERPWFTRVWVLQEVHARKCVVFICGSDSISPKAVMAWASFDSSHSKITRQLIPFAMRMSHDFEYVSEESSAPQMLFWRCLRESRSCLASDPRDKVIALISLLGEKRIGANHLIDYEASVEEVYTNTAVYLISYLGPQFLIQIRHPHALKMPSWVPDFSQTRPLNRDRYNMVRLGHNISPDALDYKSHLLSEAGSLVLHLKGLRHATVLKTSTPISFSSLEDVQAQRLDFCSYFESLRSEVSPHQLKELTLFRQQVGPKGMTRACQFEPDIEKAMNDSPNLHEFLTRSGVKPYGRRWKDSDANENFYNSLQCCKIALLDDGNLALVPDATTKGDTLFHLQFCRHPYLLRHEKETTWKLISGDCTLSNEAELGEKSYFKENFSIFLEKEGKYLKII